MSTEFWVHPSLMSSRTLPLTPWLLLRPPLPLPVICNTEPPKQSYHKELQYLLILGYDSIHMYWPFFLSWTGSSVIESDILIDSNKKFYSLVLVYCFRNILSNYHAQQSRSYAMGKTVTKLALVPGLTAITIALYGAKQHEVKSSTGEKATIKRLAKIRCMWLLPTSWERFYKLSY